ncbi:MAG: hypothetical protein L3J52_03970 [Proteobacteria bacterium]|nr:hypothetical protein [Pseudomonadota bacterium]
MRQALGTKKWVEKTNGKLAFHERMAMIYQGVRAKRRNNLNTDQKISNLSVSEILPPDSSICQEAMALCQTVSQPFLFNHCMRAYFWARLLNGEKKFDDEATFIALMLHDLGLTDPYRLTGTKQQCFTLPGSQVAEEMALKYHWPDKRAAIVADAITLHLNVVIDAKHGREAQLVRIGSGADVAGLGLDSIDQIQFNEVVEKFPRHKLKKRMMNTIETEITERPCCRIAFLVQKLKFDRLIQNSVFNE